MDRDVELASLAALPAYQATGMGNKLGPTFPAISRDPQCFKQMKMHAYIFSRFAEDTIGFQYIGHPAGDAKYARWAGLAD